MKLFLIFFAGYMLTGAYLIAFVPKGEEIYLLSELHNPYCDAFFKYFTHFGDGLTAICAALIFFVFRYYNGILIFLSYAISGLIVTFLKRVVFVEIMRPINVLDVSRLNFVEGVEVHGALSFPSGHTTSAFALFFALTLIANNKYLTVLFFLSAFLVGISRMYLLQHFFIDTYAGALIGVLCCFFSAYLLENFPVLKKKQLLRSNFIRL